MKKNKYGDDENFLNYQLVYLKYSQDHEKDDYRYNFLT